MLVHARMHQEHDNRYERERAGVHGARHDGSGLYRRESEAETTQSFLSDL